MDTPITRAEHDEFRKRMEDHHRRIDARLDEIESKQDVISELVTNVKLLAANMQSMLEEQKAQGARLKKLEERDGERWRDIVKYVVTTAVGVGIGIICTHLGIQ